MGKHFSHLTPTQRTQIDAFRRAGMKVVDIAKEVGVHYTTIYRELKRCTYEHLNSDYTTEIRYNPDGAQARYEANLRAKGPELKIGNDYELADGSVRAKLYYNAILFVDSAFDKAMRANLEKSYKQQSEERAEEAKASVGKF